MRETGGIVAATLGLVIFSPTLFGLPLFTPSSSGAESYQWIARVVIGLAILGLFLSVRQRIQLACRPTIVAILARQLASMRPAASESEESERRQSLGRSSDALVDLGYLLVGYFAVIAPAAAALADASDLSAVRTLIYVAFVAALAYVVYQLVRDFVPNLGRVTRLPIGA
jgi:hypothetical protein